MSDSSRGDRSMTAQGQGGFTLVELVVASTIMALMFAGTYGLLTSGLRNWTRLNEVQELQAEATRLAASISRDMRAATTITTPTAGSSSAAVGMEPDALAGSGEVVLARPYDNNPANDRDDVVRKTSEREQDPDAAAGVLRIKTDATGQPIPMYWYEGRTVTYKRDPDRPTWLIRLESITWDKADATQEAGISSAHQSWETQEVMTRNFGKLVMYPYRPSAVPVSSSDPATNYRMYRLMVTLENAQLAGGQVNAASFQVKQLVYHRTP